MKVWRQRRVFKAAVFFKEISLSEWTGFETLFRFRVNKKQLQLLKTTEPQLVFNSANMES